MKTIVCYGDSNTNGCNPRFDIRDWALKGRENAPVRYPREIRWTGVLAKLLGAEYYVIEEGLPGRTTMYDDAVLPYRNGKDYIVPCMFTHAPIDLLIVMLGTNDVKALFSPSEVTLGMGVEEFLKVVKNPALWDGKKAGNILLVAPPAIGDNIQTSTYYGMFNEESVRISKKFPEIYQGIAELYDCHFLNASDYVSPSPYDSIHLSEEDHWRLAEAMAEKIREILC